MDCNEAKTCIRPFLDGTCPPLKAGAFLKHIKTCPSCYEELETGCLIRMTDKDFQDRPEGYDLNKMMDAVIEKEKKKQNTFISALAFGFFMILGLAGMVVLYLNGLL